MRRGSAWTLLFFKKGGASLAAAQVSLGEGVEIEEVCHQVLPQLEAEMKKRAAPWVLRLQAGSEGPAWEDEEASARLLRVLGAWAALHGAEPDRGLGRVHEATLEEACGCLLGGEVHLASKDLDAQELAQALEAWRRRGARPARLRGAARVV